MGFRFENMMLYVYSHSDVEESQQVASGYVAIFNSAVGYSVSVAGHSSGQPEVMQQTTYYPFGYTLEQSNYYSLWSEMNKNLYNGKELQDDELGGVKLDWYDYSARFYDPQIGRWNSIDPLAEMCREWSSYTYTNNNPIRFVDPDGMLIDDYFNKEGRFLGKDESKTDNVRIIDQFDWDSEKIINEDGTESIGHIIGNAKSSDFSTSSLSENATLSIYDHYNPTDLGLAVKENENGSGGLVFHAELKNGKASSRIDVKFEGNKQTEVADHANEIINMFVHEEQHYNDYKELGIRGFKGVPSDRLEQRAIYTQMNHESYGGTRPTYQKAVVRYGQRKGMIFRLEPIRVVSILNTR